MIFRNLQRIETLKSQIHLSFARNFNKIRNVPKLPRQNLLARKPKTAALLVSLAFVPPIVPSIYSKEPEPAASEPTKEEENEIDGEPEEPPIDENPNEPQQSSFTWKELWSLIRPNFHYCFISIVGSLAIAYLNIQIPISLGQLANELSKFVNTEFDSDQFFSSIKEPAIRLIWSYLLQGMFTTLTITSLSALGENMAVDLRTRLFQSIVNQDIEFFDKRRTGEILNVLTADIQEFKSSFKTFFTLGLRALTQSAGCAASLYFISPKMSAFLCALVANLVLVGSLIGGCLRRLSRECQQQSAKCSAIATEVISSVRTIKSCSMEQMQVDVYRGEIEKLSALNQRLGAGISIFQGLSNVGLNGVVLSCLIYGGHLLSKKEIQPGDLMSFLVASQTIQRSLASLSLVTGHYVKYVASGNRIFDFISMEPKLVSTANLKLDPLVGELSFRKVNFAYPTRKDHQVFENFNMRVNPGTTFALVGHSGSGKSTIAQLLERFYDVDSGSVNIDGVNIKDLDLNWLRSKEIGYINQEPTLFAATIMENIRYGRPEATDEEVYRATKLANAHEFIEKLPEAYQTMVGERGTTLSGGQRQRVAIAREILKNPRILILDEATSNLDSNSEKLITEALERTLMKGRTVLIIAHRLSTIKNADVIAVLQNGRICELGNHDELVRQQGIYWQLIRQQQSK